MNYLYHIHYHYNILALLAIVYSPYHSILGVLTILTILSILTTPISFIVFILYSLMGFRFVLSRGCHGVEALDRELQVAGQVIIHGEDSDRHPLNCHLFHWHIHGTSFSHKGFGCSAHFGHCHNMTFHPTKLYIIYISNVNLPSCGGTPQDSIRSRS